MMGDRNTADAALAEVERRVAERKRERATMVSDPKHPSDI